MPTDKEFESVKPGNKTIRRFDGSGLYFEVSPNGGKWWRLKYCFLRKDMRLALGVYPDVELIEAREARTAAKPLLERGIDPAAVRREGKKLARSPSGWQ